MQYLLLNYLDYDVMTNVPRAEAGRIHGAYMAYTEAMKQAGAYVTNSGLSPATNATTLRTRGGETTVLDGPFAETKEQLAGFYLIDVPDLDAALTWARRHPGVTHGAIEVRPVWG